jgi:hypothetical protein
MKIIKGLIYTDKQYIELLEDRLKEIMSKNILLEERIYKAVRIIEHNDITDYRVFESDLLKILKGEENENN